MSFTRKTISVTTDGTGAFSSTYHIGGGILHAVSLELGDLSTPDLDITDTFGSNTVLLSVNGVASDTRWQLGTKLQDSTGADASSDGGDVYGPPVVMERVLVEITGGGANKSGTVRLYMTR